MLGRFRVERVLRSTEESRLAPRLVRDEGTGERFVVRSLGFDRAGAASARASIAPLIGLEDPHLAAIRAIEDDPQSGEILVVADWIDGVPLSEVASSLSREGIVRAIGDVLLGLSTLHALAVAHGDVSPGNVIVRPDGRGVLVDPAFAEPDHAERGTLQYLAPERVLSSAPSITADVYSCGATLLHALTGAPPFPSDDVTSLVRAILAGLDREELVQRLDDRTLGEFVARWLAVDPSLRPADALAARSSLLVAAGLEESSRVEAAPETLATPIARSLVEQVRRVVADAGRSKPKLVAISVPDALERDALFDAFRRICRGRGWSMLDVDRLADPAHALERLRAIGAPTAFLSTRPHDDESDAARNVRAIAVAMGRGEIDGLLVVRGNPDSLALQIPHDVAIEIEAFRSEPIDAGDVAQALERTIPRLVDTPAFAAELWRVARGSSRGCVDLHREFARAGGFIASSGAWVADLARMPSDFAAVEFSEDAAAALEAISSDGREIARILACVDVVLTVEDLASALGWQGRRVLAALVELERAELSIDPDPPRFAGRLRIHAKAAARRLPAAAGGTTACVELARRLARRGSDVATWISVAELLAAGKRRAAGRIARRASGLALDPRRSDSAIALRAHRLEQEARVPRGVVHDHLVRRAKAYFLARQHAEALRAYEELERLDAGTGEARGSDAAVEHAQLLERLSRPEEGAARLERALPRARGADVLRLKAVLAWMHEAAGDPARARAEGSSLFELRGAVDDASALLEIAAVACALFDRAGDRRRARSAAIVARRSAFRLGRTARAAHFDSTLAMFDVDAGRIARALRRLERSVVRLESAGDRRLLPDALTRLGFARLEIGDYRAASANFQRARILFSRADDSRGLGWALAGEGVARLRAGDALSAVACFEQSVERRTQARSVVGVAISAAELVRAHAWRGDEKALDRSLRDALACSRAEANGLARLHVLLAIAEVARDRGDVTVLRGVARRASLLADRVGSAADRAYAETLIAEIESGRGGEIAALRRLRGARRLARGAGGGNILAEANGVRAAVLALARKPRSARRALDAAARSARDPATRASIGIAFARAVRTTLSRGSGALAREGREAARDALRAALAVGHKPRSLAARELVAALETALEGPLVHRDLELENRRLRQVLEASRWINEAGSVSEVLSRILDSALELTGASRGFVVTGASGAMRFEAARNLRQRDIEQPEMQLSRSIVDRVLREGRTVVTSEARADERFRDYRSISRLELLSVLCAPLTVGRGVIGAIYVDDPERVDRFDDAARAVVEAFAEHAAIALDQARLRSDIEALNARLATDVRDRTLELQSARRDLEAARRNLEARGPRIVTQDPRVLAILEVIERVADSDAPVLVLGEPGTGKELVARELHDRSHRRRKPFVAVNAASLPESLVEAELFGHKKGAFTGAVCDHDGLIVSAAEGTLFLDEIAEMPLPVQAKLLRVLQDGEVLPVGATKPVKVRFRLVAATNRPLKKWVEEGRFRDDLYWRLRVLEVTLPPLRERRGDIALLISHFLGAIARSTGHDPRRLSPAALHCLDSAPYPGNVRELQSVVQSAVLTAPHDPIEPDDLPAEYRIPAERRLVVEPPPHEGIALKDAVSAYEKSLIEQALAATSGNRVRAAKRLGITRRWLLTLIDRYGL